MCSGKSVDISVTLTDLSLSFLALSVSKSSSGLTKHLQFIFIHINRIWSGWLSLRLRVNLTRAQLTGVILKPFLLRLSLVTARIRLYLICLLLLWHLMYFHII